jgi:DNA-binding transcriptional ArsR family regulator
MGDKEWSPSHLIEVLGDESARRILLLASEQPMSADELADRLGVSQPTIYRRLNTLREHDLLVARQRIDPDGNHYKTFETTFEHATVALEDGGYRIDVQLKRSLVERFESFWTELEALSPDEESGSSEQSTENDRSGDLSHG